MAMSREAPSLVKLCIGTVIANLRYVGDVSGVDLHLLKDILPHCTVDQLICIENSTQEVDLSPVTNNLWKRFYKQQFGEENMMLVVRRMKQKKVVFKWKMLYEAKIKEREVFRSKSVERLKQRYEEELAKKQSKQIRICSKIPPSGNKRSFSSDCWGNDVFGRDFPDWEKCTCFRMVQEIFPGFWSSFGRANFWMLESLCWFGWE